MTSSGSSVAARPEETWFLGLKGNVTSTANTRANSHAHGCRDPRSLVDEDSPVGALAFAASKPRPS
jgi:hypothetical protein